MRVQNYTFYMKTLIKKKTRISDKDNLILLCDTKSKLSDFNLSKQELGYIKKEQKDKKEIVTINHYGRHIIVILPKKEKDSNQHVLPPPACSPEGKSRRNQPRVFSKINNVHFRLKGVQNPRI